MKRILATIAAVILGLLVTWACGYATSHINWPVSQTPRQGCYEIDHCNVPWWIIVLFLTAICGPAAVYGLVGFVGAGKRWSPLRWVGTFTVLAVLTVCLSFGEYAYRAYK